MSKSQKSFQQYDLIIHRNQELFVVSSAFDSFVDLVHSFNGVHICKKLTHNPHPLQCFFVKQQVITTRTRRSKVNSREDAFICNFSIQLQFHISGSFKLFEDYFVHLRAGIRKCGSYNTERTTVFDITGSSKKAFWLLKCIGINTSRKYFSRSRLNGIISTSQTGNRVQKDYHIMTTFNQSFCFFQNDIGYFHVSVCWFVKG